MRFLRRAGFALAGAILAAIISTSSVYASFTPSVEVDSSSDGTATVRVNKRSAIRFLVPNGGLAPGDRAQITVDRLKTLVSQGASPSSITTKVTGRKGWVVWGDTNICVVTSVDAKANHTDVDSLAGMWAGRLRSLLSMPAVKLSDTEITVPLAETRTVKVGGAATGSVSANDWDRDVASSSVDGDSRAVVISGKAVGDAKVTVTSEGESESVTVHVRKYAGRLKVQAAALVTGNPAPKSIIGDMAINAVSKSLQIEEGASAALGSPKMPQETLDPGTKMTVQVPVTINGGGHIPVAFVAPVEVSNLRMDQRSTSKLFYSNKPESVAKYQTLFMGQITPNEPTRLLYHHQNVMGKRFRFNIEIMNPSSAPARVHMVRAVADPMVDTVLVGYWAGSKFLRSYVNHIGFVVDIPANSKYIVYSDDVDAQKTASGIIEFREMSGENLLLRVGADIPQMAYYRSGDVMALDQMEKDPQMSDEVYPSPLKQIRATYRVGEHWAFIPLGKQAIKDDTTGKQLFGNYGVIYDLRIEINNPTANSKRVSVLFEPLAGLAGGVFFIDGRFVETKYVAPPKEFTISTYQLGPGETRRISILTVPLSGSAYPANIVVKS